MTWRAGLWLYLFGVAATIATFVAVMVTRSLEALLWAGATIPFSAFALGFYLDWRRSQPSAKPHSPPPSRASDAAGGNVVALRRGGTARDPR